MSRVAKKPISIPKQVTIEILENIVQVKGPLGQLSRSIPENISVTLESDLLQISATSDDKNTRAQSGTLRADLFNYVKGVSEGFSSTLVLVKVGANAQIEGNFLVIKIGYSNPKYFPIEQDVTITTPTSTEILIQGINIQRVKQVAAKIIEIRPPEVYKGTGILKKGQRIKLKAAKKK